MKNNTGVIVIGIIIIALLAYIAFKPKDSETVIRQVENNKQTSSLTQQEAERLVNNNWGSYTPGEGLSLNVTIASNSNGTYNVVAIYGQADDSVSAVKKEGTATYQNGSWSLSQPVVTQSCHPGRGHTEFTASPCF